MKGLGYNVQDSKKPSKVVKDGNVGFSPSVKASKKIASRLALPGTPALMGKR